MWFIGLVNCINEEQNYDLKVGHESRQIVTITISSVN